MSRGAQLYRAFWSAIRHKYVPYTDPRVLGILLSLTLIPRLMARGWELAMSSASASVVSAYIEPQSTYMGIVMLLAGSCITVGLVFRRTLFLSVGHVLALAVFVWYSFALVPGVIEAHRSYSAIWTSGLLPVVGHALRLYVLQHEIRRSFYGTRKQLADR